MRTRHVLRSAMRGAGRLSRSGFTMVEALIAMIVGVLILSAAVAFLITQMRTLEGGDIREDLARNARFIGISLRHDVQSAGIELASTTTFGSIAGYPGTYGDTLMILYVPYLPSPAPPHDIDPPAGTNNPLDPGGTCGANCVDVVKDAPPTPLEIAVGDLARLQVASTRRLILIDQVAVTNDTSIALSFTTHDTILHQPAGMVGGLLLDRFSTYVQKLNTILYYLDDQRRLWRATRLNPDGSPNGDILAYGVQTFDVKVVFADGDELDQPDPYDVDTTNDYDDIVAVRVQATLAADRADPRINNGKLLTRSYEWVISPRNLRYEKNRL